MSLRVKLEVSSELPPPPATCPPISPLEFLFSEEKDNATVYPFFCNGMGGAMSHSGGKCHRAGGVVGEQGDL